MFMIHTTGILTCDRGFAVLDSAFYTQTLGFEFGIEV
jgi:hypothetical protein